MPKQLMLCSCSFSEMMVSSLMSLEATIVIDANHGMSNLTETDRHWSAATEHAKTHTKLTMVNNLPVSYYT